jgi:predicted GIY-YIG superfamily endonuclease
MSMTGEAMALPPDLLGQTEKHAVYRCYSDQGQLLYVGTTGQLGKRFASHAQKFWFVQVRGITLEWYPTELEALNAERRAIHVEHPKFNVQHRNQDAKPRNGKPRRQRRPPPQSLAETLAQARAIVASEPGIAGSELGRRLGKTDGYGRQLLRRLAATDPDGPAPGQG